MSKQTLKLHKTDSTFLEKVANKVSVNNEEWFYLPFWYHKAGDGLYIEYPFGDLPDHLKTYLNIQRGLNAIPPIDNSQEQINYLEGKY